jgi:hypothetical protein
MLARPIVRLAGNPLQRFGFRPKIVNVLSDAIGPLNFDPPIVPDLVGQWLEFRFRVFADLSIPRFRDHSFALALLWMQPHAEHAGIIDEL